MDGAVEAFRRSLSIAHGHRRIAFVGTEIKSYLLRHRLRGYRRALTRAKIEFDPALVVDHQKAWPVALPILGVPLGLPEPATAVMSANAVASIAVVREIHWLDQVHRFLTVNLDEGGLPVTGPDVDYAAVSLLLRDGDQAEQAVERLVGRGAVVVHADRDGATAAIAGQVAARGEAVTVTVATNDEPERSTPPSGTCASPPVRSTTPGPLPGWMGPGSGSGTGS